MYEPSGAHRPAGNDLHARMRRDRPTVSLAMERVSERVPALGGDSCVHLLWRVVSMAGSTVMGFLHLRAVSRARCAGSLWYNIPCQSYLERVLCLPSVANPHGLQRVLAEHVCSLTSWPPFVQRFALPIILERSSILEAPGTFVWKLSGISALTEKIYSGTFTAGGYNWRLLCHPASSSLGLQLEMADSEQQPVSQKKSLMLCLQFMSNVVPVVCGELLSW